MCSSDLFVDRFSAVNDRVKLSTNAPRRGSKGMKPDRPMAAAAVPLPVPVSPSSRVEKSSIRFKSQRLYNPRSQVKTLFQSSRRS